MDGNLKGHIIFELLGIDAINKPFAERCGYCKKTMYELSISEMVKFSEHVKLCKEDLL